jgi:hypothetical protein
MPNSACQIGQTNVLLVPVMPVLWHGVQGGVVLVAEALVRVLRSDSAAAGAVRTLADMWDSGAAVEAAACVAEGGLGAARPINGCQIGSKCPILHAKWGKLCPIGFSDESHAQLLGIRGGVERGMCRRRWTHLHNIGGH